MTHPKKTYYPEYDVLSEWEEWDQATQSVIKRRLSTTTIHYLTVEQQQILLSLLPILFPSHLGELSVNILAIFDERLPSLNSFPLGSTVKTADILTTGIMSIRKQAYDQYARPFSELEESVKRKMVNEFERNIGYKNCWQEIAPSLFFKTLMSELIKIVYSDPSIWSKIGYGGPAYPRGYYAFGSRQFDKWEAKLHD
ncbi:gluconate 2-dehydrogenase subunit 3 family protein [Bacillus salitolerans]|uniref:Gluconate 2-dehydrogenase subunit 3 family protein n=1 Tax=Bacillus salitolerans TaxID=1437434 RepID=A0ABW4LWQ8_9BACI